METSNAAPHKAISDGSVADSRSESCVTRKTKARVGRPCSTCLAPSRYPCPACPSALCSLPCVARHKEQTGCSGRHSRVAWRPLPRALMDGNTVMEDLRFLDTVKRALEGRIEDPFLQQLHPPRRGGGGRPEAFRRDVTRLHQQLWREARRRGVRLATMPRGMARHRDNFSRYDTATRSIKWHLRVQFVHADVYFETLVDERVGAGRVAARCLDGGLRARPAGGLEDSGLLGTVPLNEDMQSTSGVTNVESKLCSLQNGSDKPLNSVVNSVLSEGNAPSNKLSNDVGYPVETSQSPHNKEILSEEQLEQLDYYRAAGLGSLAILCKNEHFEEKNRYVEWDLHASIHDNLAGAWIVEHPILLVVRKDHVPEFDVCGNLADDKELNAVFRRSAEQKQADSEKARVRGLGYFGDAEAMEA